MKIRGKNPEGGADQKEGQQGKKFGIIKLAGGLVARPESVCLVHFNTL